MSDQLQVVGYLGDLRRLKLRPGDKFVLTIDADLSPEIREKIKTYWDDFAGKDVKLLILERGMKLGAVTMLSQD